MKKREEYFLNTIRYYGGVSGDHFFGLKDGYLSYVEARGWARYLVTYRWSLKTADYDGFYIPLVLTALKRDKNGNFTIHMPKRILDLLKMAAFPEIIE